MPYEAPITIKAALARIDADDYVLPAIQREFVWGPDRVAKLFDSLMRGYPIGGFLLWRLGPDTVGQLDLFRFLTKYSEFDHRHNEPLDLLHTKPLHAVLDGQQRLTALNVGLRGTYAYRLPRKWGHKAENFPARTLHLEVCSPHFDADADEVAYRFEFLRHGEAQARNGAETHWFPVPSALNMESIVDALPDLQAAGLTGDALNRATKTLERLRTVISTDLVIATHVEGVQSLDRVLDIFIRVNAGGMALSSSDLLLSIATARWKERDARESIHTLVDELNQTGGGFAFNNNQVLKAALVITDATDVRFKASNINPETMSKVEAAWDSIEASLKLAAAALANFGFAQQTLTAHSVVIPLADWFRQRGHDQSWLTSSRWREDRMRVRGWVLRSLLKRGVWGSGLDTLLLALRRVMREHGAETFPIEQLEAAMATRGKGLMFSDAEIEALSWTEYGKNAFAVLAALYPGWDGSKAFHVDHIFPRKRLTTASLTKAGLSPEDASRAQDLRDSLPNLQLLEGAVNTSKQATMPAQWMAEHLPDDRSRQAYLAAHDLAGTPDALGGFLEFLEVRRTRIVKRLEKELRQGSAIEAPDEPESAPAPDDELAIA